MKENLNQIVRKDETRDIACGLTQVLADAFALYLKTKSVQRHVSKSRGPLCHILLGEQADQLFVTTDALAERVLKLGGARPRSIGQIAGLRRMLDDDECRVSPLSGLAELRHDNMQLATHMREVRGTCERRGDVTTAGMLEAWIAEAETRVLDVRRWRACFNNELQVTRERHGVVGAVSAACNGHHNAAATMRHMTGR